MTALVLVDAASDTDIGPLANPATISVPAGGINIRAEVSGTPGSVRFGLDGNPSYRVESTAPFSLTGDTAEQNVTDKMLNEAKHRFPVKTPLNKEGYWYRTMFEKLFPAPSAAECVQVEPSIACSTETALRWDREFHDCVDPSGRPER